MKFFIMILTLFSLGCFGQNGRSIAKKSDDSSPKKVALVIGNANYKYDLSLKNPINDANKMTSVLQQLGFSVNKVLDGNLQTMNLSIENWLQKLNKGDVALFYYAGHGAEIDGKNYLFATDSNPKNKASVEFEAYPINKMISRIGEKSLTTIILLDACRDNPFIRSWNRGNEGSGLANLNTPKGTFIGFAATPGTTASDGKGENGLYTEAIIKTIAQPGLTIDQIFNQVNRYVRTLSNGNQIPFKSSSLEDDFFFSVGGRPNKTNSDIQRNQNNQFLEVSFAEMVTIPKGEFNVKKDRKITIDEFLLGKYEITVRQFRYFVEKTNYITDAEKETNEYHKGGEYIDTTNITLKNSVYINWRYSPTGKRISEENQDIPVVHITWFDAIIFCNWLSEQWGLEKVYSIKDKNININLKANGYRLPNEIEWQYAASNGTTNSIFTWGDEQISKYKDVENLGDQSLGKLNGNFTLLYNDNCAYTAQVGTYRPNKFELYDMGGNVSEWCNDFFDPTFFDWCQIQNPVNLKGGYTFPHTNDPIFFRVVKGGNWLTPTQNGEHLKTSQRDYRGSYSRWCYIGFRIARNL